MRIFILQNGCKKAVVFRTQIAVAAYLGVSVNNVRSQFSRKGFYKKGAVYVYKDILR